MLDMGEEEKKEEKKVEIDKELLEFIKMELEEKKRKKEAEERKKAIEELKKYVPNLVDVPDNEEYEARHIRAIAKFLSECKYKPREERPTLIRDLKDNFLILLIFGGMIVIGILGIIF